MNAKKHHQVVAAFTMNEHHDPRWLRPSPLPALDWATADVGMVEAVRSMIMT